VNGIDPSVPHLLTILFATALFCYWLERYFAYFHSSERRLRWLLEFDAWLGHRILRRIRATVTPKAPEQLHP